MLKVVSLFSGIGAFEKAFKVAEVDYELVNFCEFDEFAPISYCAIHGEPIEKNLGDVTKVKEDELEPFDVLTWGSPCQDFSVAGKGEGARWSCSLCGHEYNPLTVHYSERDKCPECEWEEIDKTRSSLLVEGLRILRANKPKFSIYENVKNLTGKANKETFKMFLDELEEYGYNNYWKVLNAKDYGIPQNRERVFVVSIRKDVDNKTFEWPEPYDNGLRLKDFLEDEVEEKYYISNEKTEKLLMQLKDKNTLMLDVSQAKREGLPREYKEISTTLTARDYKEPRLIKEIIPCLTPDRVKKRQNGRRFKDDGDPMFTLTGQDRHGVLQIGNIVDTGNWDNPQRGRIYSADGCSPTLNCCGGGGLEPKILTPKRTEYGKSIRKDYESGKVQESRHNMTELQPREDGISNTLTTVQKDNYLLAPTVKITETGVHKIESPYRIRKLTPKEYWRLMGFKDKDFDKARAAGISDSQLYKQAGNSIVVDVLVGIIKGLPIDDYVFLS